MDTSVFSSGFLCTPPAFTPLLSIPNRDKDTNLTPNTNLLPQFWFDKVPIGFPLEGYLLRPAMPHPEEVGQCSDGTEQINRAL